MILGDSAPQLENTQAGILFMLFRGIFRKKIYVGIMSSFFVTKFHRTKTSLLRSVS